MADYTGFKEEPVARRLKKFAKHLPPDGDPSFSWPYGGIGATALPYPLMHLGRTIAEIPAAVENADKTITLGTGNIQVYWRDRDADPNKLVIRRIQEGIQYNNPVSRPVFNYFRTTIPADTFVGTIEDPFGDAYVQPFGSPGIVFQLTADLVRTDAEASGTIIYGGSSSVTLYNVPHSDGDFIFHGDEGAYGVALLVDGRYYIYNMECPSG